jgi:hypothetical protein
MEDVEFCGRECCRATQKAVGASPGAMGTAAPPGRDDKKGETPVAAHKAVEASPVAVGTWMPPGRAEENMSIFMAAYKAV